MRKEDLDIIIITMSRWDDAYSSSILSLAKELCKTNRVFYTGQPFTWKDYWTGRNDPQVITRKDALLHGKDIYTRPDDIEGDFTVYTPKLVMPINWLPKGKLYKCMQVQNDERIQQVLDRVIEDHGIKNYILFNSFSPFYGLSFPKLKPRLFVYQCRDDISQAPYVGKHGPKLEGEMARAADVVINTATRLQEKMSQYNQYSYMLPNGAQVELFATARQDLVKPEELKEIDKPIICYVGNLDDYRVDFELMIKVADAHPDKILLLVGPLTGKQPITKELLNRPNVLSVGSKPIEEVPAYLKYSQVAIIPFLKNELNASIYPLKINEYLATGIPTLTMDFSEDVKGFADVIEVAGSHDAFVKAIDGMIANNSEERIEARCAVAAENSWAGRVQQFWDIVNKHVPFELE